MLNGTNVLKIVQILDHLESVLFPIESKIPAMDAKGNLSRLRSGLIIVSTLLLSACETEEGCLICQDYGDLNPKRYYYSDYAEKQSIIFEYDECTDCVMGANKQQVGPKQSIEPELTNRTPGSVL